MEISSADTISPSLSARALAFWKNSMKVKNNIFWLLLMKKHFKQKFVIQPINAAIIGSKYNINQFCKKNTGEYLKIYKALLSVKSKEYCLN